MKSQSPKRVVRKTLIGTLLAMTATLAVFGIASATNPNFFKQCANGTAAPLTCFPDGNWTGGNLNGSNSRYAEGTEVPQKMIFDNVSNTSHIIGFQQSWTRAGKHTYDWPDSWANAEATYLATMGVPLKLQGSECSGMGGADLTACTAVFTTTKHFVDVPVPDDPFVSGVFTSPAPSGSTQGKINAFEAGYSNRTIRIYTDAPIVASMAMSHTVPNGCDFAAALGCGGLASDNTDANYTIWITPTSGTLNNILVTWAAHVSIGDNPLDPQAPGDIWGIGTGASQVSGAPYHVNNPCMDAFCFGGGGVDNQMQVSIALPIMTTQISNASRTLGQVVTDTATFNPAVSGQVAFYRCITPSAADCIGDTGSNFYAQVGTTKTITSALSANTGPVTLNIVGVWCFRTIFVHNPGDLSFANTQHVDHTNECVTVNATNAVRLSSMRATSQGNGVSILWNTGSEVNTAGFNIYRAESKDGPYTRINAQLIAATNTVTGNSYQYVDATAVQGKTYFYQLEDVELNGTSARHDPIALNAAADVMNSGLPLAIGLGLGAFALIASGLFVTLKKLNVF